MNLVTRKQVGLKPVAAAGGKNLLTLAAGTSVVADPTWTQARVGNTVGWLHTADLMEAAQPACIGAWTPNTAKPWNQSTAAAYTARFSSPPAIVHWYQDLENNPAFDPARCDEVVAAGAIPLISWEMDNYQNGVAQPTYINTTFTSGVHEPASIAFLAAAGVWDKPFLLRPLWEMSGAFYSWAAGLAPNTPGSFIDAWRHVARLVRLHAPLAQLVWCPSVDLPGLLPLEDCYPGHAYVDVLGLDGYRKTAKDGSFQQIFQPSYDRLTALAPGRPILVAEVGCCPGPDQAAWIAALPAALASMPAIRGLTWFSNTGQAADYRLTSDPATLAAWSALAALPTMRGVWI